MCVAAYKFMYRVQNMQQRKVKNVYMDLDHVLLEAAEEEEEVVVAEVAVVCPSILICFFTFLFIFLFILVYCTSFICLFMFRVINEYL